MMALELELTHVRESSESASRPVSREQHDPYPSICRHRWISWWATQLFIWDLWCKRVSRWEISCMWSTEILFCIWMDKPLCGPDGCCAPVIQAHNPGAYKLSWLHGMPVIH